MDMEDIIACYNQSCSPDELNFLINNHYPFAQVWLNNQPPKNMEETNSVQYVDLDDDWQIIVYGNNLVAILGYKHPPELPLALAEATQVEIAQKFANWLIDHGYTTLELIDATPLIAAALHDALKARQVTLTGSTIDKGAMLSSNEEE